MTILDLFWDNETSWSIVSLHPLLTATRFLKKFSQDKAILYNFISVMKVQAHSLLHATHYRYDSVPSFATFTQLDS